MFEFYRDCTFVSTSSWLTLLFQGISAIAALAALFVISKNLIALLRTQRIQTHMNLVTLENEVNKNYTNLKTAYSKWEAATLSRTTTPAEFEVLTIGKDNAFILYISSADKLASLINAQYLKDQFNDIDWKDLYFEIFKEVKIYYDNNTNLIPGKTRMIRNLIITLNTWDN